MSIKITKEEADRIMNVKGNVRLATFNTYYDFIMQKSGEMGIKKIEARLKDLGYPMNLEDLSRDLSLKWAKQAQGCLILVTILEYLGWEEPDAQKIGYFLGTTSFFTKIIVRYIISLEKTLKEAQRLWKKHYAFSELKLFKYDLEEKYVIFRIYDFKKFHLALYYSIGGYISKIIGLATGGENLKLELSKCIFWDDPYDEIKITWK